MIKVCFAVLSMDLLRGIFPAPIVDTYDDHLGTFVGKGNCTSLADAASCARNDCHSSEQFHLLNAPTVFDRYAISSVYCIHVGGPMTSDFVRVLGSGVYPVET